MSSAYYTSLSGMMAASYGLQNTSNNMANMHSPGFKRTDVFYSSLGQGNGDESLGSGVSIGGQAINFRDGTYVETQNPSDLAIVGQGFFVIRLKNGEIQYTRDGEFGFNNEGFLTERHSGGLVQGYDQFGNLVPIREKGPKTCAGKATQNLYVNGKFVMVKKDPNDNQPGDYKNTYKDIQFELANVYDAQGKAHKVKLKFRSMSDNPNAPDQDNGRNWELIDATCDDAQINFSPSQKIVFSSFYSKPEADYSSIRFSINGQPSTLVHFGTTQDSSSQTVELETQNSTQNDSHIEIHQNDGYSLGKQISFSFDANGQISYNYDNGQNITGIHVGLARFDDMEHLLTPAEHNLFRAKADQGIHYGRANQDGFGSIKSKQLESSNVDSTTEFANIVILQRMFQACSQIMDIDKQLLEELKSKS